MSADCVDFADVYADTISRVQAHEAPDTIGDPGFRAMLMRIIDANPEIAENTIGFSCREKAAAERSAA